MIGKQMWIDNSQKIYKSLLEFGKRNVWQKGIQIKTIIRYDLPSMKLTKKTELKKNIYPKVTMLHEKKDSCTLLGVCKFASVKCKKCV